MNPKIKKAWITALKSDKFEQGRATLRSSDNKYCCLGVLCELAVRQKVILPAVKYNSGGVYNYGQNGKLNMAFLPDEVRIWAGMDSCSGTYENKDGMRVNALQRDNDDGKTFEEIAQIIEEKF